MSLKESEALARGNKETGGANKVNYEIYRRPYRIRKMAMRGKEITVPPETPLKVGQTVDACYTDHFVLYVPEGTAVDENLLLKAIRLDEIKKLEVEK